MADLPWFMATTKQPTLLPNGIGHSSAVTAFLTILAILASAAAVIGLFRRFTSTREDERRCRALNRGWLPAASLAALAMLAPPRSYRDTTGTARVPGACQPYPLPPASTAPLLCTYRRADGWRKATCPVCLSEMEDGETVRVLPACVHYFHDACVGEWLRVNNTCPLCRAAPDAADGLALTG